MATSAGTKLRRSFDKSDGNDWVQRLGRAGLGSRGTVYVIIGFLAIRMAFGDRSHEADRQGALQTIARQPFGRFLLIVLAVGFLGYAAWRIYTALFDHSGGGDGGGGKGGSKGGAKEDAKKWMKRAAELARGLLYLSFALSTAKLALFDKSSGGAQQQASWTAKLLKLPMGKALVITVGLAVMATGLASIWRGLARKFEKHLKEWEIPNGVEEAVNSVGLAGFVGRGIAFCLVGAFLIQAALAFDANKARGLDGALHDLAGRGYGVVVLLAVGLGLLAFGVYSFCEARFRRILGT
jgi:hypothetical protein